MLRFNKKVVELTSTLRISVRPLANFFIFFAVIYFTFAQFGYIIFGRKHAGYFNLITTLETLFSMMLMNFDFDTLYETNKVLGPLFFLVYVIVLAFVVINMFVTILNESYYTIKSTSILTDDDYQMVDYVMEQIRNVFGGLAPEDGTEETNKCKHPPRVSHYIRLLWGGGGVLV